jgi:hypothetical protein
MKFLQSSHILKLIAFIIFFLLLNKTSNAQFLDSLAMFVVADAVNMNAAEIEIQTRLEENLEFDVFVVGQNEANDDLTDGVQLILISATVSSGTVAGNMPGLATVEVPVINWEPFLYDALGHSELDGGEFNATEIYIVDSDHPLAAGLPEGVVTITTGLRGISYGMPVGDVSIVAVNAIDSLFDQAVLFGYEKGAEMFLGTAPARRVGTFLLNDVADSMTTEGWALFDASVFWAMSYTPTGVDDLEKEIPTRFVLRNNYPNPFNPATNIEFSIPVQTYVRLSIFNTLGQKVATLVDEFKPAGNYKASFNASSIPSGTYFYKLEAGSYTATKKMLVLK